MLSRGYVEDTTWEPTKMKIYALKHKDEIVELAINEWQLADSYKFENPRLKDDLVIVSGTFTEETEVK